MDAREVVVLITGAHKVKRKKKKSKIMILNNNFVSYHRPLL